MALVPNPCLDDCEFALDTATGKSSLRLDPAGLISCGPAGLKVTVPGGGGGTDETYNVHHDLYAGAIAVPGAYNAGLLAPGAGPATVAFACAGIPDWTPVHNISLAISAVADMSIIEGGAAGTNTTALACCVDGGAGGWRTSQIVQCYDTGVLAGYNGFNATVMWRIAAGYNVQPRFFFAHTINAGATCAVIRATQLDVNMMWHWVD